jgi:hypothetical protein
MRMISIPALELTYVLSNRYLNSDGVYSYSGVTDSLTF